MFGYTPWMVSFKMEVQTNDVYPLTLRDLQWSQINYLWTKSRRRKIFIKNEI